MLLVHLAEFQDSLRSNTTCSSQYVSALSKPSSPTKINPKQDLFEVDQILEAKQNRVLNSSDLLSSHALSSGLEKVCTDLSSASHDLKACHDLATSTSPISQAELKASTPSLSEMAVSTIEAEAAPNLLQASAWYVLELATPLPWSRVCSGSSPLLAPPWTWSHHKLVSEKESMDHSTSLALLLLL